MPRETAGRAAADRAGAGAEADRGPGGMRSGSEGPGLSPAAVEALRPWLDVEEVGWEGLSEWLISIVPLLPPTGSGGSGSRPAAEDPVERIGELARALADCASDRAQVHFRASRYFADNQVLVLRVKALEGMLQTRERAGKRTPLDDPESERAVRRYAPREVRR